MPIEFRHQPNAFVTGPLSWLAAYGLERAQGKQQMAQLEAQRSQELNNSIFGALSNIGTSYIDGRTQRYLSDMERQHELEDQHTAQQFALDRIAATQGPFAAEQQMVEFYQSMGLQPNHQAPSYLQAQAVVDNEIQTIKRRFDSGELTQEQFSLGMSKALKKKQSILPPFEPPPPPPESFPMFDQYGQPIMDESGQPRQFQKGGMYEMPDGRMMFMGERSGFADPKFFDPVNDDAYKPPSPADIQRIIDKADHDMSTAEATLKYHQMQAEARMNPRELAAKVGEQKAAEAEQLREKRHPSAAFLGKQPQDRPACNRSFAQ